MLSLSCRINYTDNKSMPSLNGISYYLNNLQICFLQTYKNRFSKQIYNHKMSI